MQTADRNAVRLNNRLLTDTYKSTSQTVDPKERKCQIWLPFRLPFSLTDYRLFVFYIFTTAAGIILNDEKFGMLCGNHIYIVGRKG